jgi:hypothetical protein
MPYLDPMSPDPREGGLPKWAQTMLGDLRRHALDSQRAADAARLATDPKGSGAILDPYSDIPIGLGRNPKITFVFSRDGQGEPNDTIDVRLSSDRPGAIELMGSAGLSIRPQVTNMIHVWPDPR